MRAARWFGPATLALLLAACGGAAPASSPSKAGASQPGKPAASAAPVKLAVSYPQGGAHLPLWYAKDKGLFAAKGLDVDLKPLGGGSPAMAALTSGQTQIADITGSVIATADAGGADVLALATLDPVYPYVLEVSSDVKTTDDLRGKAIAVRAFGDATDIAARVALRSLGLTPDKDVHLIEVNSEGARVATALAGKACCTVAQPQDRQILESSGFHELFDFSTLKGVKNAQGVIAVQRSWAAANHATVENFMSAVVAAIAAEKQDKPGSVALIRKYLKLDTPAASGTPTPSGEAADTASRIYNYFVGQVIPANPVASADQFTDGIAILAGKNPKLKGFDMKPFIDGSYLKG